MYVYIYIYTYEDRPTFRHGGSGAFLSSRRHPGAGPAAIGGRGAGKAGIATAEGRPAGERGYVFWPAGNTAIPVCTCREMGSCTLITRTFIRITYVYTSTYTRVCLCAYAHGEERWNWSEVATIVSGSYPTVLSQVLSLILSQVLSQLRSQRAEGRVGFDLGMATIAQ